MKKMICLFPIGENVHLVKDVGMIPYMLQKEGYYKSTIAFYEDKEKLPYLSDEVAGLSYKKISKIFRYEILNVFVFLLKNLNSYDVVMMFHPSGKKVILAYFIKLISFNKVKFYFKMDVNDSVIEIIRRSNRKIFSPFSNRLKKWFFAKVDLFTVESRELNDFFNNESYIKTKYLPNGFLTEKSDRQDNIKKENIFLVVGRLGAYQKNHELFLSVLSKIDLKDWSVSFVGPIEDGFHSEIDRFYRDCPDKKNKVIFTGNISDRDRLNLEYAKSKVFVLTSRWEGFSLSLVEAIGNGCAIVSTDMSSSRDMTNCGEFGRLFSSNDGEQLASILNGIINGSIIFPDEEEIKKFAKRHFGWKGIAKKLNGYLN